MIDKIAYQEAYCEVLYPISNMSKINRGKIDKKFIEAMEKNKNPNYKVNNISLNRPNELKKETKSILSVMYRKYFCSKEEQKRLNDIDTAQLEKLYNCEKMYEKNAARKQSYEKAIENEIEYSESVMMVKENNKIKKLFSKIRFKLKKLFKNN